MTKVRRRQLAWHIILIAGAAAFVVAVVPLAFSHEAPKGWNYPWACCSNQDCQQVTGGNAAGVAVSEPTKDKPYYTINSTGETIMPGDTRIKDSPDGEYHWCAHPSGLDAGHTICLFVPQKSF